MRAVIQRVTRARVTVDGTEVGAIGPGLLLLLGVHQADGAREAEWLAGKIANLRIFADESGKMNRDVRECRGSVLVVSQFTLYGDTSAGRRPSWIAAARPEHAEPLVQLVVDHLRHFAHGQFHRPQQVDDAQPRRVSKRPENVEGATHAAII